MLAWPPSSSSHTHAYGPVLHFHQRLCNNKGMKAKVLKLFSVTDKTKDPITWKALMGRQQCINLPSLLTQGLLFLFTLKLSCYYLLIVPRIPSGDAVDFVIKLFFSTKTDDCLITFLNSHTLSPLFFACLLKIWFSCISSFNHTFTQLAFYTAHYALFLLHFGCDPVKAWQNGEQKIH